MWVFRVLFYLLAVAISIGLMAIAAAFGGQFAGPLVVLVFFGELFGFWFNL